jgi:hypothetical protein
MANSLLRMPKCPKRRWTLAKVSKFLKFLISTQPRESNSITGTNKAMVMPTLVLNLLRTSKLSKLEEIDTCTEEKDYPNS